MAKNKNESVFDTETLLMAIEIMKTMPDNAASSAAAAAAFSFSCLRVRTRPASHSLWNSTARLSRCDSAVVRATGEPSFFVGQ